MSCFGLPGAELKYPHPDEAPTESISPRDKVSDVWGGAARAELETAEGECCFSFQLAKGQVEEGETRLFLEVHTENTGVSVNKLQQWESYLKKSLCWRY